MTLWAVLFAGAVAVLFAGVMFFHRSLYVSAVSLLVVLLQTGLIFLLLGAPLLGLIQVMVYAGAVMVLVVVTLMAAGGDSGPRFADFSFPRPLAWAGVIALGLQLLLAAVAPESSVAAVDPSLQAGFSRSLFSSYALATEAVTLLMFLAALAIVPQEGAA